MRSQALRAAAVRCAVDSDAGTHRPSHDATPRPDAGLGGPTSAAAKPVARSQRLIVVATADSRAPGGRVAASKTYAAAERKQAQGKSRRRPIGACEQGVSGLSLDPAPAGRRELVRLEGFEPPTNGFGSHYSIRLSYRRITPRYSGCRQAFPRADAATASSAAGRFAPASSRTRPAHRGAEEVALHHVAAAFAQSAKVASSSTPSATTLRPKRCARSMISEVMSAQAGSSSRPRDEGLVDLQFVGRDVLEVGQARIAGAEVVDRDLHAQLADARKDA